LRCGASLVDLALPVDEAGVRRDPDGLVEDGLLDLAALRRIAARPFNSKI
jgi:hypothetical protein